MFYFIHSSTNLLMTEVGAFFDGFSGCFAILQKSFQAFNMIVVISVPASGKALFIDPSGNTKWVQSSYM